MSPTKESVQKYDSLVVKELSRPEEEIQIFTGIAEITYENGDEEILRKIGRNLVGKVPLFFPPRKVVLAHVNEAEAIIRADLDRARLWFPAGALDGECGLMKFSIEAASGFALILTDDIGSNRDTTVDCRQDEVIISALSFLLTNYLNDSVFESFEVNSLMEAKRMQGDRLTALTEIWNGKYSNIDDVPKIYGTSESVLRICYIVSERCKKLASGRVSAEEFENIDQKPVAQTVEDIVASAIAFHIAIIRDNLSANNLYSRLRGSDCAVPIVLRIGEYMLGIPDDFRTHLLYRHLFDISSEASGLMDDVLSLLNDIAKEFPTNIVIQSAKQLKGRKEPCQSFWSQAMKMANGRILQLKTDVHYLTEQLLVEFPDNPAVAKLLFFIKECLDAGLGALNTGHFGPIMVKVRAI